MEETGENHLPVQVIDKLYHTDRHRLHRQL